MPTSIDFSPLREDAIPAAIDAMVARARALYTLPTVAVEVIQLTSQPGVEPKTLKDCILRDPALTAKILRVVNSSLFGLSGEVSDLNQAIALLGIKPLKILVLGFSLPDNMFAGVARKQLEWYWTTTLTRAVAAREISERLFRTPGDEAFLAGLLQGLGVLVFLKQLGPTYASLLSQVIEAELDLPQLEHEMLGFDHIKLTESLLTNWNMPRALVEAIASQHDPRALAKEHRLNKPLARVLHLANLTTELVGRHHLSVLPDLLEAGASYCRLDKAKLHDLIVSLQPKVSQLAEVLSLDVQGTIDYTEVLINAHEQMSELTETSFDGTSTSKSPLPQRQPESLLDEARQLRVAMDSFLRPPSSRGEEKSSKATTTSGANEVWSDQVSNWITMIAATCRSRRQALSVVIIDLSETELAETVADTQSLLSQFLDDACRDEVPENNLIEVNSRLRRTLILPAFDRQQAVGLAQDVVRHVESAVARRSTLDNPIRGIVSAGVASVTLPSKSFRPIELLHTAERCLSAAKASETSVVKSLEIY
jgi:HD-like signal output (HDOD) protein